MQVSSTNTDSDNRMRAVDFLSLVRWLGELSLDLIPLTLTDFDDIMPMQSDFGWPKFPKTLYFKCKYCPSFQRHCIETFFNTTFAVKV